MKKPGLLKDESGASSVLVIFMMIVLVTLAAFSMSAANVNLKLCKKAVTWNRLFYELDGQGEQLKYALARTLSDPWALGPEVSVTETENGLLVSRVFTAAENPDFHLTVELLVNHEGTGFAAVRWEQWQEQTDVAPNPNIWNGNAR